MFLKIMKNNIIYDMRNRRYNMLIQNCGSALTHPLFGKKLAFLYELSFLKDALYLGNVDKTPHPQLSAQRACEG